MRNQGYNFFVQEQHSFGSKPKTPKPVKVPVPKPAPPPPVDPPPASAVEAEANAKRADKGKGVGGQDTILATASSFEDENLKKRVLLGSAR